MATTNLISKSLGDVLTESGNGIPDHTSPAGSLYSDKDSGLVYQNSDGTTLWFALQSVAYGEGTYQDNTVATTINTVALWVAVGNSFTEGDSVGLSANTDTLVIKSGYDGVYEVRGDVTLGFVAGTNDYEVGLSVDNTVPVDGTYMSSFIDTTYNRQHVGIQAIVSLTGGTTLELAVRNITTADNIIVRHAQLFARKVG